MDRLPERSTESGTTSGTISGTILQMAWRAKYCPTPSKANFTKSTKRAAGPRICSMGDKAAADLSRRQYGWHRDRGKESTVMYSP
jgi:hypothetical protein